MLAVIVVRDAELPAGADETISECGGRVVLVGSGTAAAALGVQHVAREATTIEIGDFKPAAWAAALVPHLVDEPIVVMPASPDGRDFAPRLAAQLQRPLYAMAIGVSPSRIDLVRHAGSELHSVEPPPAFVATLQPGVRGADHLEGTMVVREVVATLPDGNDPTIERLLPPDAATIDLSEADRIVAGGAGLDDPRRFEQLAALGAAMRASVGATRVDDRSGLGCARAPDRHHRRDRGPEVVRRVRDQRSRAAHHRARPA